MSERERVCERESVCGREWEKECGRGGCVGERVWERVSGDGERVSGEGERVF